MTSVAATAAPRYSRKMRIAYAISLCLLFALGWTRPGWRHTDMSVKVAAINTLMGECSDQIPLALTGFAAGTVTRDGGSASYSATLRGPHDTYGQFTAAMQQGGADWRVTAAKITLADITLDLRDCPAPLEEPVSEDEEDDSDSAVVSAASASTGT